MGAASESGHVNSNAGHPVKTVVAIDTGSMGGPMTRRVRDAVFDLTVCHANRAASAALLLAARQYPATPLSPVQR